MRTNQLFPTNINSDLKQGHLIVSEWEGNVDLLITVESQIEKSKSGMSKV